MKGPNWLVKFSVLGNAVLFVLLAGGSHSDGSGGAPIYPHMPVHLRRDLTIQLDMQPYLNEINDAQQAWDDVVGDNLIRNEGGPPYDGSGDVWLTDGNDAAFLTVMLKAHNGQQAPFSFTAGFPYVECEDPTDPQRCWLAFDLYLPEMQSPVDQVMHIVVLHTNFYLTFLSGGNRWRTTTHEFGHVLGLGDHDDAGVPGDYDGMMDSFPDAYPGDYRIHNYTLELYPDYLLLAFFPDEASCVRLLFEIEGKQLCAED